ncbi:DUF4202 family protein [Patescibacteria group bacterium]|nr:DUF4202 family protein [Patescibacteria group bacterium]
MSNSQNFLYLKVKDFIVTSCRENGWEVLLPHFERTVHWVKELKPNADESLLIAAFSHDCERIFKSRQQVIKLPKGSKSLSENDQLQKHQDDSVRIIADFLVRQGADDKITERVKMLVSKHEIGGNADQNLLKDADSLSFFENNISFFVEEVVSQRGKEAVRKKFDGMFNRISFPEAKEIAWPMYQQALAMLSE